MQKRPKKFKNGMVGRQNIPIHLKWAAMLSTLRTIALDDVYLNQRCKVQVGQKQKWNTAWIDSCLEYVQQI